jgi:hypothetical protein
VLNGFKATFLPFHSKQAFLRRIGKELALFTEDGSAAEVSGASRA